MLINKTKDRTPFPMGKRPVKQYPFLLPLIWGGSFFLTRQFHLKIRKENMRGLKPPFLVISTHQGFSDYYIAPLALFPHRANYVSDMEGFAAFGEWLYRGIGCIGKRRYVSDYTVVKNIKWALTHKKSVVVFPESRHSNVGTTSYVPKNIGKLAKIMKVPVVTLTVHGSYLANPFWDEEHTRKTPIEATLTGLFTKEEVLQSTDTKIQNKLEEMLSYNEYAWQQEHHIAITYEKRAEGLQLPLYQCPVCEQSFTMYSKDSTLGCHTCHAMWQMDEYGKLVRKTDLKETVQITDWYEWERQNVEQEIKEKGLCLTYPVTIEALPNSKGFISLGAGTLTMDEKKFTLFAEGKELIFPHGIRESVQTEYNYRGKGPCIVLSTKDCCYYIYSNSEDFNPTKIQFAGEYCYQMERGKS